MDEFRGAFQDVMVITELRGDFPDVPFFGDVDIAELTRGDDDPTFLTIPIGKVNAVSGNKRLYGEAWIQELERQVQTKRPTGMMGHEDDDAMTFPPEAIFWVGARRIGELLWGKGYLPPGSPRERIRRYKAANKTLGTSILAIAEGTWDKARGALNMLAETLDLRRIDIGPVDKLGIKDLGLVPILTAEMQNSEIEQEPIMAEKKDILQEVRKVSPQRGWAAGSAEQVTELSAVREALGVDESTDLVTLVAEMRQAQETQRKQAISSRISELVNEGVKLEGARGIVTELVAARSPQTPEEAASAYAQVMEMQSVKDTLAATLVHKMGPSQRTPVQGQHGAKKYFNIPQEA